MSRREGDQTSQDLERKVPSENLQGSSPEKHRWALVVGGMVLGVIVAYLFSALGGGPVKLLDLVFWIIGGALLGLSASLPSRRK